MVKQAFEGIKVVDFGWAIAGPSTTSYMADHGATVIRVETGVRPDIVRVSPPFKDWQRGLNRAPLFTKHNRNKYGLSLNLNHPKGKELAKRLVAWSDIVTEGFVPDRMEAWGLDYEELKKVNPQLIMISLSMQGQTGPHAKHGAYGHQLTSWTGITHLTGWADRDPSEVYIYTDFIGSQLATAVLIAALDYRRRTGKGQHLDLSQYEVGIHFLAPLILDNLVNGRIANRVGNRSPYAAPHGAYPCLGEDQWCVIAVETEDEWQSFCRVTGNPEWTKEARFASPESRLQNADELDRLVAQWTANYSAQEVMTLMQEAGVAAGAVLDGEGLVNDPQLNYRHHFWVQNHPEIGAHICDSPSFKLSRTPAQLRLPAPCLGEHNEYICSQILGMPDEEFLQLLAEGVFE